MIGRLLETIGGAKVLADSLINKFGEKKSALCIRYCCITFWFPNFFDAGFVVKLPIVFSVAKRFGGLVLRYAFLLPAHLL